MCDLKCSLWTILIGSLKTLLFIEIYMVLPFNSYR